MSAPTNTAITTATDLGALPISLSQRVDDAGTTYTVWYKYTATVADTTTDDFVRGCWFFGDLTTYTPSVTMWIGPTGAPTNPFNDNYDSVFNKPFQFPATAGVTYYFEVVPNGGNPSPANLTISIEQSPNQPIVKGTILIPEFNGDLNFAGLIGHTDGAILGFRNLPAADFGDILPDGTLALIATNTNPPHVKLYNSRSDFTLIADLTGVSTHLSFQQIRGDGLQTFFVGDSTNAVAATIKTVDNAGVVGATTWTLPANSKSLRGMAANPAHTILYYGSFNAGSNVYRYDLIGVAPLTDLVGAIANYTVNKDILCADDGTILVSYHHTAGTVDQVIHYSAAGATLNTYTLGGTFRLDRINFDVDRSFILAWSLTASQGQVVRIKISDGTTSAPITFPLFTDGIDSASPSATPPRFGVSNSCPILALDATSTQVLLLRRQRRFLLPTSDNHYTMQIPIIELLMRTGIGLKPDVWGGSTPYGTEPMVRFRLSTDGGKTWGAERLEPAGERGNFKDRVRLLQATGNYRDAVLEVTVDAPVDWQWIAAMGNPVEGSS